MADYATKRRMMVDTQVRPSDVTRYPIIQAMSEVPREAFVPRAMRELAYVGENVDLGGGRVVLEARTLAKMLEVLDVQPDEMVLDIACGLGYSSAVIARIAETVVAVEGDEALCAEAESALVDNGFYNAAVYHGDMAAGAAKHAPFDAMIIQGAIEEFPVPLGDQLKDGGRVAAIFEDQGVGVVRLGRKIGGKLIWRDVFNAGAPVLSDFRRAREFAL